MLGVTPFNHHLMDPYDKENNKKAILLSEEPKVKQISVPVS
jgi:hypothetical protein